jgi:hypothetical protein
LKLFKTYCYSILLFCLASGVHACKKGYNGRKKPPMDPPSYAFRDKNPLGTFMAYKLLPQQFKGEVVLASKKLKPINPLTYVTKTAHITIGSRMPLTGEERSIVLQYAERGNELFICADVLDDDLLDTLGISFSHEPFDPDKDWAEEVGLLKKDTYVRMLETTTGNEKNYGIYYYPFNGFFKTYDSLNTRVLGVNEKGHANYIVVHYGKGKIYLHTEPTTFSNYFLLANDNTEYYKKVFSYLQPEAETIYWNDVMRFGDRNSNFSALSIFWKNPSLLWALLISCLLMLLYVAFGSKRKRRLVPVVPPNSNATVSFVHTISNLYLQKKDNRNIALKMITYFFEHIRTHYYLSTNTIDQEFIQALSRKSGIAEKKVLQLADKIAEINVAENISDNQLFDLSNRIQEFYKR